MIRLGSAVAMGFAAVALMACGGVNRPGDTVPIEAAPPPTLTVAGDYMQIATCVLPSIPGNETDKPQFTELKAENRAVIRLNLTAGAFNNWVQLFEASFSKQGDRETAVAVRERPSLVGGPDYWKKKIGELAQSCSQSLPPPAPIQGPRPRRHG
ncbi:hypothetical protein [Mesorhizobium sp.]|uniref:hypothetical protein n=1 Tax=Mesorhizobium sp. TaxID=1871066 RepID=UPI0025FF5371|nr:hypothetical protein [Mesorhizobium sp.]